MKIFYAFCLLVFAISSQAQNLNTLSLKRTFKSDDELLKTYPQLDKAKLVLDKGYIKVLDRNNSVKKQVSTSGVPKNLNAFIFSPTQDYFIAYEETEVETSDLYFYRADGSFLAKQRINIYPNIKYSNNGENVIAFNSFGREIFVFSKTGLLVFSGDYIELINDRTKVLDNVLISDDGKQILINAGAKAYVFDSKTSSEIFRVDIGGWALDGNIYSSKGKIALKIRSPELEESKYSFKVISKTDGKVVDELTFSLDNIQFTSAGIILFSNSNIHEYSFKE